MKNKIRIAYLIDTIGSNKGGTEKQLLNIIERLDRDLFEVTLVCLYQSPWMSRNHLPCEVISLGYRGFLKPGFLIVLRRYLRTINEKRFDVVQTFFEDSIIVGYLGKKLSKNHHALILSRRDMGLGIDEPGYHWFYKKARPYINKFVDGIATNANAIKSHMIAYEKVPSKKIKVISNGIDLPVVSDESPRLFTDNPANVWIGIVANLKPVKRIDLFLRALANLKSTDRYEGVMAVVLGEGRLRPELEQLARDLHIADSVHFMGAQENVNDYLQHLDIGVLCSDKEGLSNAILEYMAFGLPVVATDVGGNCELVDETNGISVPPGDYMALGDVLARLVSSASFRKSLGEKSIMKVRNNSTWDMIMPQWESYYCSIIGDENSPF